MNSVNYLNNINNFRKEIDVTQEEIDNMIDDWVEHGFPSELKRLIPEEEVE